MVYFHMRAKGRSEWTILKNFSLRLRKEYGITHLVHHLYYTCSEGMEYKFFIIRYLQSVLELAKKIFKFRGNERKKRNNIFMSEGRLKLRD